MQWNDITDYFTKKDLLPSSELEVTDYEKLEEEFLRHVFSLGEKPKNVVLFEANARAAIELLGRWASDDPMPDLILMAKDASWATLISHSGELKNYLVFLGFSREDIENNELVLNINKEPKNT